MAISEKEHLLAIYLAAGCILEFNFYCCQSLDLQNANIDPGKKGFMVQFHDFFVPNGPLIRKSYLCKLKILKYNPNIQRDRDPLNEILGRSGLFTCRIYFPSLSNIDSLSSFFVASKCDKVLFSPNRHYPLLHMYNHFNSIPSPSH